MSRAITNQFSCQGATLKKPRTCLLLVLGVNMVTVLQAQTYTTLASFYGVSNAGTKAALVEGQDGNFYGTTRLGGDQDAGSVFKVTSDGTVTTLVVFSSNSTGGSTPTGRLVQASDGSLYGTTEGGGLKGDGTIFKITPSGSLTTIHSFNFFPDGSQPNAGLTLGNDGMLYGTTQYGGANNNNGTVFKITPSGTLTTLYNFGSVSADADGSNPLDDLVFASDGNLYGTTSDGGGNDFGTVFKMTPDGTLTTLYSFAGVDGEGPMAGLIQATDGNFYGTTYGGGAYGYGTVFKITPSGALTTLHSFGSSAVDGNYSFAELLQATDGNLYGTTVNGGANGAGTVFKITTGGNLTIVHNFGSSQGDGVGSVAALIQGTDGNLYGTTTYGGTGSSGTVFRLQLQPLTSSLPSITSGGIVSAGAFGAFTSVAPGSWIELYGSNLATTTRGWTAADFNGANAPTSLDGTSVTIGGRSAFIDYISPGQINAQVPSNIGTGQQSVVVQAGNAESLPYEISVNTTEPGLLAPSSFKVGGTQYAVALFSDGTTFVLPTNAIPGIPSRPAKPGDTITLYGVGFGPVIPDIPAGQVVGQTNTLASGFQVNLGNTPAPLTYDGLAPNAVGLYQFNVVVPDVPSSNTVPLTFTLGGFLGTQTLTIAVQNDQIVLPAFNTIEIGATLLPKQADGFPSEPELGIDSIGVLAPVNGVYTVAQLTGTVLNASQTDGIGIYGAVWNNVTVSGDTLIFTGLQISSSTMSIAGTMADITSASLTVTLTPQVVATSGTVSGSLNLVSTLATVKGTFTGTYTAR